MSSGLSERLSVATLSMVMAGVQGQVGEEGVEGSAGRSEVGGGT